MDEQPLFAIGNMSARFWRQSRDYFNFTVSNLKTHFGTRGFELPNLFYVTNSIEIYKFTHMILYSLQSDGLNRPASLMVSAMVSVSCPQSRRRYSNKREKQSRLSDLDLSLYYVGSDLVHSRQQNKVFLPTYKECPL